MQEGYYWLQRGNEEPEIWLYAVCQPEGWTRLKHDNQAILNHGKPLSHENLDHEGFRIISDRLKEPVYHKRP